MRDLRELVVWRVATGSPSALRCKGSLSCQSAGRLNVRAKQGQRPWLSHPYHMSTPKPRPEPDDEPVVDWEDFERATDLVVADQIGGPSPISRGRQSTPDRAAAALPASRRLRSSCGSYVRRGGCTGASVLRRSGADAPVTSSDRCRCGCASSATSSSRCRSCEPRRGRKSLHRYGIMRRLATFDTLSLLQCGQIGPFCQRRDSNHASADRSSGKRRKKFGEAHPGTDYLVRLAHGPNSTEGVCQRICRPGLTFG